MRLELHEQAVYGGRITAVTEGRALTQFGNGDRLVPLRHFANQQIKGLRAPEPPPPQTFRNPTGQPVKLWTRDHE
jgi:hypothetical protein